MEIQMSPQHRVPLSVLDLAIVGDGATSADALADTTRLAQRAEALGYTRFWVAEHHNMPTVASTSPAVLIAHLAAMTSSIHVGSGGVMLPNHPALVVAEQFAMLEALHPGRIDLGIGRAPGTDPTTSRALRPFGPEQFTDQMLELRGLSEGTLPDDHAFRRVRVVPTGVRLPPIWLLGSSGASAHLAGSLGIGYAFASHFSPAPAAPGIRAYREEFRPSDRFPEPHAILAVAVVCAATEEEADYLATTGDLIRVRLGRGEFGVIPSPEEALAYPYSPQERAVVEAYRKLHFIGPPETILPRIENAARESSADEVMITTNVHGHEERLRSYRLLAEAWGATAPPAASAR
jgi:luciferase family oxidoreductase group 1